MVRRNRRAIVALDEPEALDAHFEVPGVVLTRGSLLAIVTPGLELLRFFGLLVTIDVLSEEPKRWLPREVLHALKALKALKQGTRLRKGCSLRGLMLGERRRRPWNLVSGKCLEDLCWRLPRTCGWRTLRCRRRGTVLRPRSTLRGCRRAGRRLHVSRRWSCPRRLGLTTRGCRGALVSRASCVSQNGDGPRCSRCLGACVVCMRV